MIFEEIENKQKLEVLKTALRESALGYTTNKVGKNFSQDTSYIHKCKGFKKGSKVIQVYTIKQEYVK